MTEQVYPEPERISMEGQTFRFACNDTVACFTRCCRNADLRLYPYDIICLKKHLGMNSEEFLVRHTVTAFRENPNFPDVMLKMSDNPGNPCPFLSEAGCRVYENRPFSCRAYPLEPAMFGDPKGGFRIKAYLVRHGHCEGHGQGREWTAEQWMADQGMARFNLQNAAWAKVAFLLANASGAKGRDNPAMNMAFMAAYDMDTFRRFVLESSFLKKFKIPPKRLKQVKHDDVALMQLGFDWICHFVAGQGGLKARR